MDWLILLIIGTIGIAFIIKYIKEIDIIYINNNTNSNNTHKNMYYKKKLMTEYEKKFYYILLELEKEYHVRIQPQVNLATIIEKKNNNKYINELFRNIDFGIFTENYEELLLLIEINDKTHNTKSRYKRDKKVKDIINAANIKLITFHTKYPNEKNYVKNRIINELNIKKEE